MAAPAQRISSTQVYWTAFVGLLFDYYDLYLFVYLEKTLAGAFNLGAWQSDTLQAAGLAGTGLGALVFGYLADRFGRGRLMLAVFGVYAIGVAGLSLAWGFGSLLGFRLVASLALGAEWGISHTFMTEHVAGKRRYWFSALLQFAILGGLLAALARGWLLPHWGWRWLFAASIVPVAALSLLRWRVLARRPENGGQKPGSAAPAPRLALKANAGPFLLCLAVATLTIASGTVNVFFAKDLPQSTLYTVFFWGNVAPGMLLGAWAVTRLGVGRALVIYAVALMALALFAWGSAWDGRKLAFALALPVLNGIPFGLMGAWFNEVLGGYRTMLSGAAYNLGRILAGFSPLLITALGLHAGGHYFLFTAALGAGVFALGWLGVGMGKDLENLENWKEGKV